MSKGISKSKLSFPRKREPKGILGVALSMDSRLRRNDVGAGHGPCLCTGTGTQNLAVSE